MSSFALRSRSTCVRLVFSSVAVLFFEIFFFFIASASCHATTSFTACACVSSKIPSSLRKSSMLEPICFLLIAPTPSGVFARRPLSRKLCPDLPHPASQRTTQQHPNRPPPLRAQQIFPYRLPLRLW